MKKLLWVFIPILCVLFLCGCEESNRAKEAHVLKTTGTGDVVIDAGDNIAKTKMKFDIFKTGEENSVARIIITQTTPTYSIGSIVNRMDGSGSKPEISAISSGMLCRETTGETLAAEKKIYKYQKKALKRQYKLTKIKAKSETYKALDKTVQDTNEIGTITTSLVHQRVEKKSQKFIGYRAVQQPDGTLKTTPVYEDSK